MSFYRSGSLLSAVNCGNLNLSRCARVSRPETRHSDSVRVQRWVLENSSCWRKTPSIRKQLTISLSEEKFIFKMNLMAMVRLRPKLSVSKASWTVPAVRQQLSFHLSSSWGRPKQLSPEETKARQEALMRRSLPKRRRLPGVKNIILVSSGKGGKLFYFCFIICFYFRKVKRFGGMLPLILFILH